MRALLTLVVLACALVITGAPALAHAELVASDPAAGAQTGRAPQAVTLTFDDAVESELGSVRVLDAGGISHTAGAAVHPNGDARRLSVRLGTLQPGRYIVEWHVISDDSHLVSGAFAFGVGVPAGAAPPVAGNNGAETLLPILHFALLAAVLLAIGLPIGVFCIARRARLAPLPVEFGAWFVVAFAAFADVAFRADLAGGALGSAFATHVGTLRAVTMAGALIGIFSTTGRARRFPLVACASAATLVSISLAGHAADGRWSIVGTVADAFHLLAAATWIGVLAVATTLETGPGLSAISPVALTAVLVLIVTGTIQTLRNAGSFGALLNTTYGHLIDGKIALLLALIAVAFTARRSLEHGAFAIGMRIKIELWLLTAVIAVTAVLVESPLPRDATPLARASTDLRARTTRAIDPKATSFYTGVLGLKKDGIDQPYWVEFDVAGTTFGIGTFEQVGTPGMAQSRALEVADLTAFRASLCISQKRSSNELLLLGITVCHKRAPAFVDPGQPGMSSSSFARNSTMSGFAPHEQNASGVNGNWRGT